MCWTDSFSRRCCRFCRSAGTRRSLNTATVFDRGEARSKRCTRRSSISAKGTAGWWTSTWRNSSIRVNHDRLLAAVAKRVADKRLLKRIRAFLQAGVMEDGLVNPVDEGTPQGGPLDPTLIQQELDRRLTAARSSDPAKKREQSLQRELAHLGKGIERLLSAYQEALMSIEQLRERMPALRQRRTGAPR